MQHSIPKPHTCSGFAVSYPDFEAAGGEVELPGVQTGTIPSAALWGLNFLRDK